MNLAEKKLFLLDLDGTLYLDEKPLKGAADFLGVIRSCGGSYLYLTNNSSRGAEAYLAKMRRVGLPAGPEDFLTSVDATVYYLRETGKPDDVYYVCGTRSMKEQLRGEGFRLSETPAEEVTCLICGFDTELTFQKLEDSCILLNRGVRFLATNPDWVCPTWYGAAPDCGCVCEMLFRATGRRPRVIGKPQPEMAVLAMQRTGFAPRQTLIVGDRIYTDIACGVHAGVDAALVLSGESTMETVAESEIKPTAIYRDVRELAEEIQKARGEIF